MILILDTSVIIELERGNKEIRDKLVELRGVYPAPPKISFMTYFEFSYGLRKRSVKNKEKVQRFLELFEVVQTTNTTANFLVTLKDKYELSLSDLFIAAQVMESNGVLVTKDKDFERINEIEKVIL